MDLSGMLEIALKVIADWRVILVTIAALLAFALLRYVGLVYHKRPRTRARPPSSGPGASTSGGGGRSSPGPAGAAGMGMEEED